MQVTLNVSQYIRELLNRSNVQVRSLDQIEEGLKNLFATGQKKAILLFHAQVHEALIRIQDSRHIQISDDTLPVYMRPGDMVIVLLPGPDGKRYVLQTTLVELFIDRFILRILDPRSTRRLKFAGHNMIFWQVPTILMLKLEQESLHLIRADGEMVARPGQKNWAEKQYKPGFNVIDFLFEPELEQISLTFQALVDSEPIPAKLLNISLGGLCVLAKPGAGKNLKNHFLYVNVELTGFREEESKILPQSGVKIMAFAVVRSYTSNKKGDCLHLMFLSSLPDESSQYFPDTWTKDLS